MLFGLHRFRDAKGITEWGPLLVAMFLQVGALEDVACPSGYTQGARCGSSSWYPVYPEYVWMGEGQLAVERLSNCCSGGCATCSGNVAWVHDFAGRYDDIDISWYCCDQDQSGARLPLQFAPVDGGADRACRDGARTGYGDMYDSGEVTVHTKIPSIWQCQALCVDSAGCTGIEYSLHFEGGRCELWPDKTLYDMGVPTGAIPLSSVAKSGFTCLSYTSTEGISFAPVDGGYDRACRGSRSSDDAQEYFELQRSVASVYACESLCVKDPSCVGIEYSPHFDDGRCELWKSGCNLPGIGATEAKAGFTCLRLSGSHLEARVRGGCQASASASTANVSIAPVAFSEKSMAVANASSTALKNTTASAMAGAVANAASSSAATASFSPSGHERRLRGVTRVAV
jgi:hypothetical protein